MSRHRRLERLARKDVGRSDVGRHNLFAVVVQGGKVIARGVNRRHRDRTIHAEMAALSQMIRRKRSSEGCDIHVYRFMADGSYGLSKPCADCEASLREAGIRRVFYSDYDNTMKSFVLD